MTDVHPSAVAFGSVADEYERGRPGYPPEAVAWRAEAAGLTSSSTIVDVAAGTGKLTRLLGAVAGRVVAVEPSDGMRAYIARTARGVEVLDGTAQHLPLDAGSADLITVAQAFHWFASDEALAEFVRVPPDTSRWCGTCGAPTSRSRPSSSRSSRGTAAASRGTAQVSGVS
jgi:ubiquinone/menaquinone biosynthesis C-methylase UbiE